MSAAFQIFTLPSQQALDSSARALAGARLYFYLTGTSTPTDAYADSDLTTPIANPLTADSGGVFAQFFLDPDVTYRIELKNAAGAVIGGPWDPANESVLSSDRVAATLDSLKRTAAEISAGVTPVNYAYPANAYDIRRTGTPTNGISDALQGLQKAFDACTGVIYVPRATYLISDQLNLPDGIEIWCEPGTVFTASALNYHLLRLLGSAFIRGAKLTRAPAAQNTSWKAINADPTIADLPANTRIILQNLVIEDFDIGVYVDGGISDEFVEFFQITDSRIRINTLGTGGAASVRPTINPSNCKHAVIARCDLDASDTTNSVNNIYAIGNTKLDVVENKILYGQAVKVLSNPGRPAENTVIARNIIESATVGVNLRADTDPFREVTIESNQFLTPQTASSDVGVIIADVNSAVSALAFESIISRGNWFRSCPYSVYYLSMPAGEDFGALICDSNYYRNTSTASAGLYSIVNFAATGTYQALMASNELVLGETNTRSYIQGVSQHNSPFTVTSLSNVVENQTTQKTAGTGTFTGTLTGVSGTVTGTLRYTVADRRVTLHIPTITGTSNTTACTITGLPSVLIPARNQPSMGVVNDNGAGKVSIIQVDAAGTITLFNGLSATFTASGTKGPSTSVISYSLD